MEFFYILVQVRALSLTNDGNLYRGPIEFKLIVNDSL